MSIVRVAPSKVGRLVRVSLREVDERHRRIVSRRLRELQWEHELRPDTGYQPDERTRLRALDAAIELERAATFPGERGHLLPETVVADVLAKHRATE